jgi:Tfp pilus assembly PilM family ATPase
VSGFSHLHAQSQGKKQAMMLVDLGQSCTKVVVAHGPKITFCRTISPETAEKTDEPHLDPSLLTVEGGPLETVTAPTATATQVVCQEKKTTDSNAAISITRLVSEIRRCVQYHNLLFETEPIEKVIFVGGQAKNKALCQQLARELGLPAQLGDPLARIPRENRTGRHSDLDADQINSDWSIAFGLSLGDMTVQEN